MSQRVLIIGGAGQLGAALANVFRTQGDEVVTPTRDEVPVEEVQSIEKIIALKPDLVINAAWFPVAECEKDPTRAYHVNTLGAYHVARGAQRAGAIVIYMSTDYVFDGSKEEGFTEDDCPHPLNVYGASKHAGEELVAIATPRHYIIRTSALFGRHAKPLGNFVLKMQSRAEAGEATKVVSDQSTCPTFAEDLAPFIQKIPECKADFGVYHITNSGVATWYDLAKVIFEQTGKSILLEPSLTTPDPLGMLRPKWSVLRSEKLSGLGLHPLPDWKDALLRYIKK